MLAPGLTKFPVTPRTLGFCLRYWNIIENQSVEKFLKTNFPKKNLMNKNLIYKEKTIISEEKEIWTSTDFGKGG